MKVKSFIVLSLLLSASVVLGQESINRIKFSEFDLDNGLHVILHQDNSSPVVAVNIMYHVGSKNERSDRTGFAHFFEHLMFEGTENIDRGEMDKLIQNAGGNNNAGTSFDYTTYYEVLPSHQLELGLWLESERLLSLKIDSVGVETQRSVVKEERKARYENQPYMSFQEEIFKRAFTRHPYQWIPIGSAQYIDEAQLHEFIEFHDHFYVPENATLVVAGDIEIEKTKKLVNQYFGDISRGGKEIYRPDIDEPEQKAEIRDTIYDNIQLPAIFKAYKMPAMGTNDYYALSMLQTLLSGGESSRLYKALVDEQQKALQVAAFPFALEDAGLFIVLGLVNMGVDLADLEASMQTEIERIKNEGISDREFQKLQNKTENDFISSNSTMAGIASSLAQYHVFYDDANLINTEINRYMKVTKDDIVRVAKKYLVDDKQVILYYLPKDQALNN